jgi:Na+/glutamate symporter
MGISFYLGLVTAVVSSVLAFLVLQRYVRKGWDKTHLLLWGVGLALWALAGVCEAVLAFGWSDPAFRLWYWTGALVIAPILGQGTLHLLVRRQEVRLVTDVLIGVLVVASLVWMFSLQLNAVAFNSSGDVGAFLTERYREILPQSTVRRVLPPFMNGYGTVLLVGGAIYSAILFFRKQIMPNRVVGNVFIAIGGIIPAFSGSLVKLAETTPELTPLGSTLKFVSILLGVVLLFIGFQVAVRDAPQAARAQQPALHSVT